ncbi:chemotaxis protein CheW [Dyella subtropica]|uniref:chemotaxis protein CheW n=1 Tax=Dyella subtropica TaxID=2992127 RepID=UPI002255246E|nr:chemotaxis protein CheW [Dyella subtropica]
MPSSKPTTGTSGKRAAKRAAVDWRELERRLATARHAIEHGWATSPDESRRILQSRAQHLAQEAEPDARADEYIEMVEFDLAYERYAIDSRYVREVCPLENLTPLPCTPKFVLGIINLHGEILSVIDIKIFFELPAPGLTDLNKVIVLQAGNMIFGVLADSVVGVRQVPAADIQRSLPTLTKIRAAYLLGLTSARTVIIDAEKLLSDANIVVNEQVYE